MLYAIYYILYGISYILYTIYYMLYNRYDIPWTVYHIVYTNIREKMARAILGAPVFGIWGRAFECISIHSIITTLEASTHQGEVCPGGCTLQIPGAIIWTVALC